MTQERSNLLSGAFEVEGALPELTDLDLKSRLAPDGSAKLAGALKGGAAPLLGHLYIRLNGEEGMDFVVNMLEARASVPGCAMLNRFEGGENSTWIDNASVTMQIRFLKILLWSGNYYGNCGGTLPSRLAFVRCKRST